MSVALLAESPAPDHRPTLGLVNELFVEARREKRKLLDKWGRYYKLVRNKSWSQYTESWLPTPSASEIFPVIATLTSWMTDQRPRSFVSASPDTLEFIKPPDAGLVGQLTKDMQQVLDSWWITRDLGTQVQMALWDTFTFGCGVMKTGWDPTLDFGQGDVIARRVDPYAILPAPGASNMDDCSYLLEVRKVPFHELRARFGSRADRIEGFGSISEADERPKLGTTGLELIRESMASTGVTGAFPGVSTPGVPPLFGRSARNASDYTRMVLLKELWVRNTRVEEIPVLENGKISSKRWEIPYWEYLAEADGVILNEDTTNPFEHGQLPYVRLPMVEIGEFWSVPLVEHLAQAQIALNRLLAAMQLNAELTGNPIWMEPENSGIARTKILNRQGSRVRYNSAAGEPKWMMPPNMPQVVYELVGFWREQISQVAGIGAIAGAEMRRREASASIDAVQEAGFVRVRAVLRNMEEALRRVALQTVSNVTSFYIEPRTVPKVGPAGEEGYLQLGNRHFFYPDITPQGTQLVPLHFDVYMQAGSSLPISRAARQAEMMGLHFAGLLDPESVLDVADVPNKARALEYAKQQAAAAAQAGELRTGKNPRRR